MPTPSLPYFPFALLNTIERWDTLETTSKWLKVSEEMPGWLRNRRSHRKYSTNWLFLIRSIEHFQNFLSPSIAKETTKYDARKMRKYCTVCYKASSEMFDKKSIENLTKEETMTICYMCKGSSYVCLNCFNKWLYCKILYFLLDTLG